MRIVQLIDSLEPGGAEKMAVNYVNALCNEFSFAGLMVTRGEGTLRKDIFIGVHYLFLNREKTIDFKALKLALSFLKENKVEVIHAHSTSVFFGFMLKLLYPKVKLIWHDHYGKSEALKQRKSFFLKLISFFMFGIISVNNQLKEWSLKKLFCKKVVYLPNFTSFGSTSTNQLTYLKGNPNKRIVCLANLRPQKNHFLLLQIAKKVQKIHPDWTFHLIGKDFEDDYSNNLKNEIDKNELQDYVFLYGSCSDIDFILAQSTIGVLSSNSEGLPVALLEYGLNKLPVVVTKVGEIPYIINNNSSGILVDLTNEDTFLNAIIRLIENKDLREALGNTLFKTIGEHFSVQKIIHNYIIWLNEK